MLNYKGIKVSRMFLNKEFCVDGIGLRVEAWITFFNKQHLVMSRTQGIRTLSGICVGSETGFHLGDMSSRGPPKGVYQSLFLKFQNVSKRFFIAAFYS